MALHAKDQVRTCERRQKKMVLFFQKKNRFFFPWVLAFLLSLCACGYIFSGSEPFPGNVKEIFVVQVQDKVGELGLASRLRDDLIYTLTRSRQGTAANKIENADALLETEVRSLFEESLTRTAWDVDVERRLHMTAFFALRTKEGIILWQESIREHEDFKVGSDKAVTESLRREALETLSLRMSERVVERMGSTF